MPPKQGNYFENLTLRKLKKDFFKSTSKRANFQTESVKVCKTQVRFVFHYQVYHLLQQWEEMRYSGNNRGGRLIVAQGQLRKRE